MVENEEDKNVFTSSMIRLEELGEYDLADVGNYGLLKEVERNGFAARYISEYKKYKIYLKIGDKIGYFYTEQTDVDMALFDEEYRK